MLGDNSSKNSTASLAVDSDMSDRENQTLSIIIRCHKEARLPFLDEALFSLALQEWTEIEVIIVLQNGTEQFKNAVAQLIEKQPFHKKCKFQIHIVRIPAGLDGRSSLLNYGIRLSTGRYLAFLDDDDLVYQHGYKTLINQLIESGKDVAVGGCRRAEVREEFENWYVQSKTAPFGWGSSRFDLFKDNFIPIHSYVIDQTKIAEADLYFDDDFPPLEDYEFLLRIIAKYDFDFSKQGVFVCEYRIHGSNSLPYNIAAEPEIFDKHSRAQQLITERKKTIQYHTSISNLVDLLAHKNETSVENSSKPADPEITIESIEPTIESTVPENPQIIRKAFRSVEDKVYNFFSRYPRIEKRLSKVVYFGWKMIAKSESGDSNNNLDA